MSLTEWFKDITNQVTERVKSPLYSVFALSWLTSNWKAFYITLFESAKTLRASKIDYISNTLYPASHCSTYFKLIIIPVCATGIIIWLMPWLVFKAFNITEKAKQRRRVKRMEILGESMIKGERYIELRRKYNNQLEEFSKIMNEEKENLTAKLELEKQTQELAFRNSSLENELSLTNEELKKVSSEKQFIEKSLKELRERSDKVKHNLEDFFEGTWISKYIIPGRSSGQDQFRISGYKYIVNDSTVPSGWRHVFDIDRINYDTESKSLTFRKVDITAANRAPLNVILDKVDDHTWHGFENDNVGSGDIELLFTPALEIKVNP